MGALPNYKEIVELVKKGSTVEAQEKIMELREKAIDLKEEMELRLCMKLFDLKCEMMYFTQKAGE